MASHTSYRLATASDDPDQRTVRKKEGPNTQGRRGVRGGGVAAKELSWLEDAPDERAQTHWASGDRYVSQGVDGAAHRKELEDVTPKRTGPVETCFVGVWRRDMRPAAEASDPITDRLWIHLIAARNLNLVVHP
jgi:hypothetical protein